LSSNKKEKEEDANSKDGTAVKQITSTAFVVVLWDISTVDSYCATGTTTMSTTTTTSHLYIHIYS